MAEGHLRANRDRRLKVTDRLLGLVLTQEHFADRLIDPEVARMRQMDPLQERESLLAGRVQSPVERQEERRGLVGDRGGLDHLDEGRSVRPDGRIAGAIAPRRGGRIGLSGDFQDPIPAVWVVGETGPVVERGHQSLLDVRFTDPIGDRLRVIVELSDPGPAERLLILLDGSRQVESQDASAGIHADRLQLRHQLQVVNALVQEAPQSSRPVVAQPAPRSLQRGAGPGPGRRLQPSGHLPEVFPRGPLGVDPLGFRLPRHRRPVGDQPQPAADQDLREQDATRDRRRKHRPPSDSPSQSRQPALGSRSDDITGQEAVEVRRKFQGAVVAEARFLAQALEADDLKVAGDFAVEPRRRHGVSVEHLSDGLGRRVRPERRTARQQFVQDGSQGIDVNGGPPARGAPPRPAPGPCSSASRSPYRSR